MSALSPLHGSAPDLVEPIMGFRQWRLSGHTLSSLFTDMPWRRNELRARCRVGGHDPRTAPSKECTCGIYAYYDPCPRTASAATKDLVAGVVILWGRVELHATGLRAEYARVVALELPLSRARKRTDLVEVAERLGVPAVAHRELKSVGTQHGSPLHRSLRPARSWAPGRSQPPLGAVPRAVSCALLAIHRQPPP
jgi:hypothetical protein